MPWAILFLIAGAIFKWAAPDEVGGFDVDMVGTILLWVGGVGFAAGVLLFLLIGFIAWISTKD